MAYGKSAAAIKRMKQISCRKHRQTENSANQIKIMTDAMLASPMHPRQQVECFTDMSKHNYEQPG